MRDALCFGNTGIGISEMCCWQDFHLVNTAMCLAFCSDSKQTLFLKIQLFTVEQFSVSWGGRFSKMETEGANSQQGNEKEQMGKQNIKMEDEREQIICMQFSKEKEGKGEKIRTAVQKRSQKEKLIGRGA